MQTIRAAGLAIALACPAGLLAQDNSTTPPADSVIKRLDPSDFKTKVEARYEYQSLQGGGSRALIVPRFEYAVSKTFAVRVETPYLFVDQPGQGATSGFGDLLLRANYRAARGEGYAIVAGLEVVFDTAEDDRLGSGSIVVSPVVFASIDMPKANSVLFPSFQQYVSVGGGGSDVNTTQLRAGVLTRWPARFYTFLEPTLYIDFVRDAQTGATLELEVGRFVTRDMAVWVRPGVGLWGNIPPVYNWNFEVGIRYLFE